MEGFRHSRRHGSYQVIVLCVAVTMAGCAGPGPKLFPVSPADIQTNDDQSVVRRYDRDGDGTIDCAEILTPDGMIKSLGFDADGDGTWDEQVTLADIPADERRHLFIILDSIPFEMVRDSWANGRFRFFHPPARVISPFPVMTDVALADFFHKLPVPGVESAHFDGEKLRDGYDAYASDENTPWAVGVDYRMRPLAHAFAYLDVQPWYAHELGRVQDGFAASDQPTFAAYVVGTSALGAKLGREGHQFGLVQLDRFCQYLIFETRGRIHITLMSDHGHHCELSERIPLADRLTELGYRVRNRLDKPGDVVVPEFGPVTLAVLHTRSPDRVARDVVGLQGIDLAAYCDAQGHVVVLSQSDEAVIARGPAGFSYTCRRGDPLHLRSTFERLRQQGKVDENGFADDLALFEATESHIYPDAVSRLWRAFHELIQHTPDVMVSVQDGYHCGSATMSDLIDLAASHGGLRTDSSTGFVMTSAGPLPEVTRMQNLRAVLQRTGVRFKKMGPGDEGREAGEE